MPSTSTAHVIDDAATAEDALARFAEGKRYDLLLTDVVLPGLSGVELVRRVRRKVPSLKVLYCSGYVGDETSMDDLVNDLRSAFLPKPFTRRNLLDAVNAILSQVD